MNTKGMAKNYKNLTREERFRLIMAACDRGDDIELQRLQNGSNRITFSQRDYSRHVDALHELANFALQSLVEDAAMFNDAFQQLRDCGVSGILDWIRGLAKRNDARSIKERTCYAVWVIQGVKLRTKVEGWKLFCARLGISPFIFWQGMPGFERLERAIKIVEATPENGESPVTPKGVAMLMSFLEPDEPPTEETDLVTAEMYADALEAEFRKFLAALGG